NITAPIILQKITNLLPTTNINSIDINQTWISITHYLIFLACIYIISIIGGFTYSQLMAISGQKYMDTLRKKLFNHMEDLPVKYFDQHDKGDIMSIYINDVDTVRQLIVNSLSEICICSFTFVAVLITMLSFSIWISIIVIIGGSFMLFATKHVGSHSSKNFITQQKIIGQQEGYVEEMMNGLKVIKSFCHEEESKIGFEKINESFKDVATKANKYANILMPILGNIGNLNYVLVAFIGVLLFIYDVPNLTLTSYGEAINVGIIVGFLPLVKQFTNNASQVANQINSIALAIGGCNRVVSLLDEPKEVDNGYVKLVRAKYDNNHNIIEVNDPKEATIWAWKHPHTNNNSITYTLLEGEIRMYDVDFGYVPNKIVLHDINLYAKPGQKVAFVGATGAGKTTITNLLNRFYDIADGKIRYDGININKICKKDLRKSLGMVLQDTNLFTGTIMDNIRYGKLDATDEECIAAAKLANADSFIERLPQGYNTYLTNDGANLSQGQRQLLSIARAAVNNAPVLILDEATSSIDTRTEAIVTKGMDNLMKGRTVFVIAHRLSTIQNSDVIMVLDHGRIIERGTHDDLIKAKGVYYQLYTGAFELE
ncbi:MAG TPA: ABC transporter, partial [Firmicutes bacterium]|nr:ABC transporter [Bacillota bacterium]